jgi:hypothetical protein
VEQKNPLWKGDFSMGFLFPVFHDASFDDRYSIYDVGEKSKLFQKTKVPLWGTEIRISSDNLLVENVRK